MDGHSVVLSHLNNKRHVLFLTLGDKIRRTQIFCNTNLCTLSNSSMQTTPPSASTMAPPSMMNPRVAGSLNTEAVRPAALLPLPEV